MRVVVLRPLGLGDLCTAVPALRGLRETWPHAEIALAAPLWQEPLARLAGVDHVVATAPRGPLDPRLRAPDVAVNLHGCGPASTERAISLEPDRLIAFAHPAIRSTQCFPVWRDDEHETQRWCRLLTEAGVPADPSARRLPIGADPGAAHHGAVVIHPGAAAPGRRWPYARFGQVAGTIARGGGRVVVVGSRSERALCDDVVAEARKHGGSGNVVSLAGVTGLLPLARLIAGARLLIGNDSGVAHLATLTATPSVVLFGPTDPARWGPPETPSHVALWKGRTGNPHAQRLDRGLAEIQVDEVLEAASRVIDAGRRARAVRVCPGTPRGT